MTETLRKEQVLKILRRAHDFPWRMQDIGLLGLPLDDRREHRLHVWDPSYCIGEPPIHDHPYDFTSRIIAGELTNVRYQEDPEGEEHVRFRYPPDSEIERRSDAVRLNSTSTTYSEGGGYHQRAPELHASWQQPGTVTVIRCTWVEVPELTVCYRDEGSWLTGRGRAARPDEIDSFVTRAFEWF